eukprot:1159054-Pelagomonas_calceolata.AAC.9
MEFFALNKQAYGIGIWNWPTLDICTWEVKATGDATVEDGRTDFYGAGCRELGAKDERSRL